MKKFIKEMYLKSILYDHFEGSKNDGRWRNDYFVLCENICDAIKILEIEDFDILNLVNFDYIVSIAKKMPEDNKLRHQILLMPGMKEGFNYDSETVSQYGFFSMQAMYFYKKPSNKIFNKKGLKFEFLINIKNMNFDLNVNNEIINGEIKHLDAVKNYVLENEIDLQKENIIKYVSEHLKLIGY